MLYPKLQTKEGENEVFKLVRVRERRIGDFGNARYIKDKDGKILVEEVEIKEKQQMSISKIFNGEVLENSLHERQENLRVCNPIQEDEIKEA